MVCRCFGHSLFLCRRPCPSLCPWMGFCGRLVGQGLQIPNKLCPKILGYTLFPAGKVAIFGTNTSTRALCLSCPRKSGKFLKDNQESITSHAVSRGTVMSLPLSGLPEPPRWDAYSPTFVMSVKFSFSGHESFFCRSLWLKKGYDALIGGVDFNAPDAVVALGVGKNMVSSIRYWMKSFGLTVDNKVTPIASYIFSDEGGVDPYIEDNGTLWLLHYLIVTKRFASLYHLAFLDLRRERKEFDKDQFLAFVQRKCALPGQKTPFSENTVRKDISVFIRNYVAPSDTKSPEDFSALLIDLGLISSLKSERNTRNQLVERFVFNETPFEGLDPDLLLYALLDYKGTENTLSFDKMQELALVFGYSIPQFIEKIKQVVSLYPDYVTYTDNSGVRNIQFLTELDKESVLDHYYHS